MSAMYRCTRCGVEQLKIRLRRAAKRGWVYVGDCGRWWAGGRCPSCKTVIHRLASHKSGRRAPIDLTTNPTFIVSRRSERLAQEYLKSIGYIDTALTTAHGPDITCEKNGVRFTVEVKTVRRVKQLNCWVVEMVQPNRRSDDLIAFVLPGEFVHVESMADHLRACDKNAKRTVTTIVRSLCPHLLTTYTKLKVAS